MKKRILTSLLIGLLMVTFITPVFAVGCARKYTAECSGCNVNRLFKCTGHYNEYLSSTQSCTYVLGCTVRTYSFTHHMKCPMCGYGGGAYDIDDKSIEHDRCSAR